MDTGEFRKAMKQGFVYDETGKKTDMEVRWRFDGSNG